MAAPQTKDDFRFHYYSDRKTTGIHIVGTCAGIQSKLMRSGLPKSNPRSTSREVETEQSRGLLGLGEVRCGSMSLRRYASREGQPGPP